MSVERRWNDTDQEKIAELGQKPVPVSVHPTQIPPELEWSPYRPVAERRSLGKRQTSIYRLLEPYGTHSRAVLG